MLQNEAAFDNGITRLPMPGREDPVYGAGVLGPTSEATGGTEALMGVVRTSRHPEVALDFLRYVTSLQGAARFTKTSRRVSSTVGAPSPPELKQLAPRLEGELPGFNLTLRGFGGGHSYQAYQRNLHLLLGPGGAADAFAEQLEKELPHALREDFNHHVNRTRREARALDGIIGLHFSQNEDGSPAAGWSRLTESQQMRQAESLRYQDPPAR
jgi:multiple sugar transport system substrate-binding protein/raffinose/stachyose/melibiose transport system substrate-binding protein